MSHKADFFPGHESSLTETEVQFACFYLTTTAPKPRLRRCYCMSTNLKCHMRNLLFTGTLKEAVSFNRTLIKTRSGPNIWSSHQELVTFFASEMQNDALRKSPVVLWRADCDPESDYLSWHPTFQDSASKSDLRMKTETCWRKTCKISTLKPLHLC